MGRVLNEEDEDRGVWMSKHHPNSCPTGSAGSLSWEPFDSSCREGNFCQD